jgi:hypothetical protein
VADPAEGPPRLDEAKAPERAPPPPPPTLAQGGDAPDTERAKMELLRETKDAFMGKDASGALLKVDRGVRQELASLDALADLVEHAWTGESMEATRKVIRHLERSFLQSHDTVAQLQDNLSRPVPREKTWIEKLLRL